MPSYMVGVYEESMATIYIEADDELQAADKIAELLEDEEVQHLEDLEKKEGVTFEPHYRDVGVAIDASDPEEIRLAVTELANDS